MRGPQELQLGLSIAQPTMPFEKWPSQPQEGFMNAHNQPLTESNSKINQPGESPGATPPSVSNEPEKTNPTVDEREALDQARRNPASEGSNYGFGTAAEGFGPRRHSTDTPEKQLGISLSRAKTTAAVPGFKKSELAVIGRFRVSRSEQREIRLRPRLCENSADAQFPGSSNPSRGADRRSWADLEGRLCAKAGAGRVLTQVRRETGKEAEGVSPAVVSGMERIVIVSDDGDRDAGRFASYLLLDPAQLQTAA